MTIYLPITTPTGHYVYSYHREDGTPYYIGKGSKHRAWIKSKGEIQKPKHTYLICVVAEDLTLTGALALERRLIRWYGRKDLGTGILRNLTDGGDGLFNPGPEIREKISASMRGKSRPTKERVKELFRIKYKGSGNPNWKGGPSCHKKRGPRDRSEEIRKRTEKKRIARSLLPKKPNHFKGKTHSPETLTKLSALKKGTTLSDEHKHKIAISNTGKKYPGRKLSQEHKKNISKGGVGRVCFEETRAKISETMKRKHEAGLIFYDPK